jgi:hypothetical protein
MLCIHDPYQRPHDSETASESPTYLHVTSSTFFIFFSVAIVPITTIPKLEQEISRVIKNINLSQFTANGLLYCRNRAGGLRIQHWKLLPLSQA